MTTKHEAKTAGDAPKSERRPTDPGLGASNEEATTSAKPFDPRRFQANTMPPGLRSVVIGTELPSMPRDRIEETMPPTDVAEVLSGPVSEAAPLKAISFRLAVPLGILIFAAGALAVLLVSRGNGPSAQVGAREGTKVVADPNPVTSPMPATPLPAFAPTSVSDAPTVTNVNVDEPVKARRATTLPKAKPRAVELPKSTESRARSRNEDPD